MGVQIVQCIGCGFVGVSSGEKYDLNGLRIFLGQSLIIKLVVI